MLFPRHQVSRKSHPIHMNFRASRPAMDRIESLVHGSLLWMVMIVCLYALATLGQTDVQSYVVQYRDQYFGETLPYLSSGSKPLICTPDSASRVVTC